MVRPKRFVLTFTDPWSGDLALQVSGQYSCKIAANGGYYRMVNRLRKSLPSVQPILEGRTPRVSWYGLPSGWKYVPTPHNRQRNAIPLDAVE